MAKSTTFAKTFDSALSLVNVVLTESIQFISLAMGTASNAARIANTTSTVLVESNQTWAENERELNAHKKLKLKAKLEAKRNKLATAA